MDNIIDKLYKKFEHWWLKIAENGFYIIDYNNNIKYIKFKNDIQNELKLYSEKKDVKYILLSGPSSDNLIFFIYYILNKCNNKEIEILLNIKKIEVLQYLINNFTHYFSKSILYTKKDYKLKYYNKLNESKIISKFKKSTILIKLL